MEHNMVCIVPPPKSKAKEYTFAPAKQGSYDSSTQRISRIRKTKAF